MRSKRIFIVGVLSFSLLVAFGSEANAFKLFCDRLEVKGYIRNQQVFRVDNFTKESEHIQARTILRLEGLWKVADEIGLLKNVTVFGVFEPYYDAVFDMYSKNKTWGGVAFPNYPNKHYGFLTRPGAGLHPGDRDEYAWKGYHYLYGFKEYTLAFDIEKLTMRIGKQIVTWGRSDIFRLADIINPQDYSWHFICEGVEETRIPLHLVTGIYNLGTLGPLADVALEFVYNPGDFTGDYLGYEGLPWNVIPEPGMHHWQRQNRHYGADSAEFGFRVEASLQHVNFTLNYYNAPVRSFVLDLSNFFATFNEADIIRAYPRAEWIGFTAEYDESRFTRALFRTEFLFIKNLPHTIDVINAFGIRDIASVKPQDTANALAALAKHPNAIIDKNVIKYVIGCDRPTWIRLLNPSQTFMLSAQLFAKHILQRNGVRMMDGPYPTRATEFMISFATWTDYMHGRLRPWAGYVYDCTSNAQAALVYLQYLHGNHWVYKVGLNSFAGRETNMVRDTSSVGGLLASARHNDELYFSVQYQF